MKSTLMSLALLGQAAAFPAVRGVFAPEDVEQAKEMFRRNYIQAPEETYPVEESSSYPLPTSSYEIPKYPVGHPTYPVGVPPVLPTGSGLPHPPVYPTGSGSPYPPVHPTGSGNPHPPTGPTGTGNPEPPTTYTQIPPTYTNTNTYTVTSGSEYVTYTTTGYTNVETISTGFVPTSTPVASESGKTYYSTYLYPTYSTGYVASETTGYEIHVPETGCPAAHATTIYKTETVYVSAGPAVTPGPDAETYTVTDKYGSTKTIVIPGTSYVVEPPATETVGPPVYISSEEVETKTYTVVPEPVTTSATHLPPVYPTHSFYPTGTGSTGVVPYPTGTASYYKPSPKPEPTGHYNYGYPTEPEPTKAWYALF